MTKISLGIVGYGNLGRGVETGIKNNDDMELVGIFSRRDPETLTTDAPAYLLDDILKFKDKIDVLVLCGGSQSDIPEQAPALAEHFNTVDAYDNHALMTEHFEKMDVISKEHETVSVIATGWDPGLFSINRLFQEAILPKGETYTFWGRGLSQGHSDAVRRVSGVKKGAQYTIPDENIIKAIQNGEAVEYDSLTAHNRGVYVVLEEGANPDEVESTIKNMPDYFAGYDTQVSFISEAEFDEKHQNMSHGGRVMRQGKTSDDHTSVIDYSLKLDSNPEFTAAVNLAYARAANRLANEKQFGAQTVFDIPAIYLSPRSRAEIIKEML